MLVATRRGDLTFDVLTDFDASGDDRIDLGGIDADLTQAGHPSFNFVGNASGNRTGDLSTRTFGSNDADRDPDFAIVVYGAPLIDPSDFII